MHPPPPPAAGCGAETCRAQLRSPRLCSIGPYTAVCFKVGSVRVGPRPRQAGSGSRSEDEAGILHLTSPGASHAGRTRNVCAEKLLPWERPRQVFPDATSWGSAQTAAKNPDRLHPQTRGHRPASSPDPTQRLPPRVSRAEGQGRCWGKGCVFQLTSSVSRFFPPKFSFPLEFFFFSLSDFYYTHQNSNPRSKSLSSYPLSITRMS